MTYNPDKPDAGPSPNADAATIRNNFSQFATIFARNHTALNAPYQGEHEVLKFQRQTTDPTVEESESTLFCFNAASNAGTQPQLFTKIQKFLPTEQDPTEAQNRRMQLTYNTVNTAGPQYQSFLTGGYILYFGMITDITVPITLSPVPSSIVFASVISNNLKTTGDKDPFNFSIQVNTPAAGQLKINSTLNGSGPVISYSFTWIAIGVA